MFMARSNFFQIMFVVPDIDDGMEDVRDLLYDKGIISHMFFYNRPKGNSFRPEIDDFLSDIEPVYVIHPPVSFNDNWLLNSDKPNGIKALLAHIESKGIMLHKYDEFDYVGPWDDRIGFGCSNERVVKDIVRLIETAIDTNLI
jgi:hypothetical protein